MIKHIVISGAPGTGKTSIINLLKDDGYICNNEISRDIIINQQNTGGNITPWQDLDSFTKLVFNKRLEQLIAAHHNIEFFDRGIIDTFAYLLKENKNINKSYIDIAKKHRYYNKVFITPPWEEIYKCDSERKEDFSEAVSIHKFMINAYEQFGYDIYCVPKLPVKERVRFILKQIES